ncbi:37S ribosomal protein S22 [Emmonsiellopsis sp. PD_33]|nr:37S ribosomal protein S22 [Emmonsiellopsis sp. PD_33]
MLSKRPPTKACTACSQALIQRPSFQRALPARQGRTSFAHDIRGTNSRRLYSSRSLIATTSLRSRKTPHGIQRFSSTSATTPSISSTKEDLFTLVDKIHQKEEDIVASLQELGLVDSFPHLVYSEDLDLVDSLAQIVGHRNEADLAAKVALVRQKFRESLPEDLLSEEELQLYKRLYGEPAPMEEVAQVEDDGPEPDKLFREDHQGGLVQVDVELGEVQATLNEIERAREFDDDIENDFDYEEESLEERANTIARMLGGEVLPEDYSEGISEDDSEAGRPRAHPRTTEGKFSAGEKTIKLPVASMTKPVSKMLSAYSNKHIAETAHKVFGGPRLPHSTSTAPKLTAPAPIQLDAAQHNMSEIESHAYLAVLYPGVYASVLSALVEVRKRLGSKWLRDLMAKEGGPKVLDAGGGGSGILAWRDILKAEWALLSSDDPEPSPAPLGKSTVLTGSNALRHRASALLDDTTFLPRLPDYVHVRDQPTMDDERPAPQRKQFDVIIAPHTIWPISEDHLRKNHVQNLWSLLNPDGGVLILLEKGHQRGFEAIAGAREMILERLISSPGSTQYENFIQAPSDERFVNKGKGMIIAPCTNHAKCPMYLNAGKATARKDFCHFSQRYIRPAYLQRILGATDRNHEDVKFSYVAVQRGVDKRETDNIIEGQPATDAAFAGYEGVEGELPAARKTHTEKESNIRPSAPQPPFHPLALPRLILPPIKSSGHIILDMCTPSGKIERWTVAKSFSKQAYRDARKSAWGDLWALGAKTRVLRNIKVGRVENSADAKFNRRLEKHELAADEQELFEDEEDAAAREMREAMGQVINPQANLNRAAVSKKAERKNKKLPTWVKKMNKKRTRKALKEGKGEVASEVD